MCERQRDRKILSLSKFHCTIAMKSKVFFKLQRYNFFFDSMKFPVGNPKKIIILVIAFLKHTNESIILDKIVRPISDTSKI